MDAKHVGISLNETVTSEDLQDLIELFTDGQAVPFTVDSLASEVHDLIDLSHLSRVTEYLTHPIFNSCRSEHEMLRYIHRLQVLSLSVPLGTHRSFRALAFNASPLIRAPFLMRLGRKRTSLSPPR